MNLYAVIILVTLLVDYGLDIVTNLLNLRALREDLPRQFRDVYDREKYRKSQAYTRVRTRFGLLTATFDLVVLLVFWFSGGFEYLDNLVRSLGFGPILSGLIYIGTIFLASSLISLPFTIYSTFVTEERFGFNRTTPRTFIIDLLKGTALTVVLGAPLLAAILWFFGNAGTYAWLYAWIVVTVLLLLFQYIAPRFIMPLFNRFEPLRDEELRQAIFSYVEEVGFPVSEIYVMDGSKRSSKSNAFFTGMGNNRRIVLFDTLVERHNVPELLTVVAHEIGHYKEKHIPQRMLISVLHTGILFLLLSIFLEVQGLYEAFYVDQPSVYTGLLFFGLLFSPVEMLLSIPMQMLSRRHEYEADRFAVRTTGKPESFINALKKLSEHNLSNLTPHPVYVFFHYSHPPLTNRIAAITTEMDLSYEANREHESPGIAGR